MAIQFYHFQGTKGFSDAPDTFSALSDWQVLLVELSGRLDGKVQLERN